MADIGVPMHSRSSGSTAGPAAARHHRPSPTSSRSLPKAVPLAAPAPRFRLPEVIVGVLLVAGSALGGLVWHRSSSATTPALVLAHAVERGHVFSAADFAAAEVHSSGVRLIRFDARSTFVGRIAAIDLNTAAPLTEDVALATLPIAPGQALVGRLLKSGEYPSSLATGSTVRVVLVESDLVAVAPEAAASADGSAASTSTSAALIVATVEDVRADDAGANATMVTLRVGDGDADRVADAAGVRLVQVGG